jgi:ribosomal protein S18 acetylase RimI-like enzyme
VIQEQHKIIPFTEDGRQNLPVICIEQFDQVGNVIARLRLETDGTIYGIWVKPEHRRKGIATQLWNYATANGYNPQHSAERTTDGDAWAKSFNVPLPELITV